MGRKGQSRAARLVTIGAAAAAVALAAFLPAATAGQVFKATDHVEETDVFENFCDAGITVDYTLVFDLAFQFVPHGDGLWYYVGHGRMVETFTNADGDTVTSTANVTEKDQELTDNGDGTFTVISLSTGNATVYGPNGKAIARNPGQTRFELVFAIHDPDDVTDDELLSRTLVKGSTGRSDDFCAAVVSALA